MWTIRGTAWTIGWTRWEVSVARWRALCLQLIEPLALFCGKDLAHLALDLLVDAPNFGIALFEDRIELRAVPLEDGIRLRMLFSSQIELAQRQGPERRRTGSMALAQVMACPERETDTRGAAERERAHE
jgi:hypothetical protein